VTSASSHRIQTASRFNPDGRFSYALPGRYYYEPGIFERERDAIWYNSWQYVGNVEDLAEVGSYITADVHGQSVLVVRERPGELKAFYNVCKHRGHLLAKGKGKSPRFVCNFHGWCYGRDGRLVNAPNEKNILDFDRSEFALTEIRVEEFGLWVFVHLGRDPEPLAQMAGDLLAEIRSMVPGYDNLKSSFTHSFKIAGNWKFILDGLECYHCPYLHPSVMGANQGYMTRTFDTKLAPWHSTHIGYTNREYLEKEKHKLPYDFGEMDIKDVLIWFLWPNLVFVSHQGPSNIKILQAVSDGPEQCRRFVHAFTKSRELTVHDQHHIDHYVNVVWPQDQAAIESQAIGVRSRGFSQGRLMVDVDNSWASEAGTHHFEHLVWKALNGENY
jgi:phenylpropionate dioxygenase-like ring-hydroxylating dioxygenase large terminal subunit